MNSQCPDFDKLLRYFDKELSSEEMNTMKKHLDTCSICQKERNLLKKLRSSIIKYYSEQEIILSLCLSDESLAAFVDNLLSDSEKEKLEEHLSRCPSCVKKLIDIKESVEIFKEGNFQKLSEDVSNRIKSILFTDRDAHKIVRLKKTEIEEDFEMIECKTCNSKNPPLSKFCNQCGNKLDIFSVICIICGKEILEGSKFCNYCGIQLVLEKSKNKELWKALQKWLPAPVRENKWLVGAIGAILASFAFPAIFLQFLLGAGIMGGMWIMEKGKRDLLNEIYKAWKEGNEEKAKEKIVELKRKIMGR